MKLLALLSLFSLALADSAPAADMAALSPTPPMGWNSWDAYGTTVQESEVKANADYMAKHLKRHGWQYVVVDIQWSEQHPQSHGYRKNAELAMDGYGRLIPAPNRFPSAAGEEGFKPLADYVHRQDLKFGIHIMRGIPRFAVDRDLPVAGTNLKASAIADRSSTCRWNTDMYGVDIAKGGQAYYDSIVKLYAGWGVDFIKADDMATPLHAAEIEALHKAIVASGRPIVLSLSPGPADVNKAEFYRANANLWRISDDFWDKWSALKENFAFLSKWAPHTAVGGWPDADMLPLGRIGIRAERGDDRRTRFTPDEQQTMMSLWSIARSPLMFGGDLPSNDESTLNLITNDEVLTVDQHATGSRPVDIGPGLVAWVANAPGGKGHYLGLFNIGEQALPSAKVTWQQLNLPAPKRIRDLWLHRAAASGIDPNGITVALRPHASRLLRLD